MVKNNLRLLLQSSLYYKKLFWVLKSAVYNQERVIMARLRYIRSRSTDFWTLHNSFFCKLYTWGTWIPCVAKRCLSCKRRLFDTQPHSRHVLGSVFVGGCFPCFRFRFVFDKVRELSISSPESPKTLFSLFCLAMLQCDLKCEAIESRELKKERKNYNAFCIFFFENQTLLNRKFNAVKPNFS